MTIVLTRPPAELKFHVTQSIFVLYFYSRVQKAFDYSCIKKGSSIFNTAEGFKFVVVKVDFYTKGQGRMVAQDLRHARVLQESKFDIGPNGLRAEKIENYLSNSLSSGPYLGSRGIRSKMSTGKKSSARRVYLGGKGLAAPLEQEEIENFLRRLVGQTLGNADIPMKEDPISAVKLHPEKEFCFVELRTDQLATICIMMNGVVFRNDHLKIKRPSDYTEGEGEFPGSSVPGLKLLVDGILDLILQFP